MRTLVVWVAACNFVTVGSATYLASGHSVPVHVLAWVVALAVGVAAGLALASAGSRVGAPPTLARPRLVPERAEPDTQQSVAVVRERESQPRPPIAESTFTEQLALGTQLRAQLQRAISDATPNGTVQLIPEIDSWIATTRALLDERNPQLAQYFTTDTHDMTEPNWPSKLEDAINLSQSGRLDRHLERLNEILSPSK
jgi:hypothetical protein